jgi:hypothetical protein
MLSTFDVRLDYFLHLSDICLILQISVISSLFRVPFPSFRIFIKVYCLERTFERQLFEAICW